MIYFTTFILTLLLSHIAHATSACGDVNSPEELYESTYADAQQGQHVLPPPGPPPVTYYTVTVNDKYGKKDGKISDSACSALSPKYKLYKDFENVGAAWSIKSGGQKPVTGCGTCWRLTEKNRKKSIYFVPIDAVPSGYSVSKEAFGKLSDGQQGGTLQVEAKEVEPSERHLCGYKDKKP